MVGHTLKFTPSPRYRQTPVRCPPHCIMCRCGTCFSNQRHVFALTASLGFVSEFREACPPTNFSFRFGISALCLYFFFGNETKRRARAARPPSTPLAALCSSHAPDSRRTKICGLNTESIFPTSVRKISSLITVIRCPPRHTSPLLIKNTVENILLSGGNSRV